MVMPRPGSVSSGRCPFAIGGSGLASRSVYSLSPRSWMRKLGVDAAICRLAASEQGPCSLAASLQIAASIPNFLIQERGDNEYSDLLAKPLPPIVNGYRPLLTEPGLGITIDENKLMAQVGEPRPYLPQFDADDGSVVDW